MRYIYIYICFSARHRPVFFSPWSFYYRPTNHICQMGESSHLFSTMGILRLLRWLCLAAPQPLCLDVLNSRHHMSPSAFLLTLSNIQGHFHTGIIKSLPEKFSSQAKGCGSTNDPLVHLLGLRNKRVCFCSAPAASCPPLCTICINNWFLNELSILFHWPTPLTPAGDPVSPISPTFLSLRWEQSHTRAGRIRKRHTAAFSRRLWLIFCSHGGCLYVLYLISSAECV